ncbi:MAG: fibrobacter succinogenes major paralogous domain-containing protein [Bacteroidota bacterium]
MDGNEYVTVIINNREWMAENLRVSRYNNADSILTGLNSSEWLNATVGAYGIYPYNNEDGINSAADMIAAYGKLYNWYAVSDSRGLCPAGWSVPSKNEWENLVEFTEIQGYPNSNVAHGAANALKSCYQEGSPLGGDCNSSQHPRWNMNNTHYGFDIFGFAALPGGSRWLGGEYVYISTIGGWWSSTVLSSNTTAWFSFLEYDDGEVFFNFGDTQAGLSVRCVRDDD